MPEELKKGQKLQIWPNKSKWQHRWKHVLMLRD